MRMQMLPSDCSCTAPDCPGMLFLVHAGWPGLCLVSPALCAGHAAFVQQQQGFHCAPSCSIVTGACILVADPPQQSMATSVDLPRGCWVASLSEGVGWPACQGSCPACQFGRSPGTASLGDSLGGLQNCCCSCSLVALCGTGADASSHLFSTLAALPSASVRT